MPSGRKPSGEYPVTISAATKVSEDEQDALLSRFPTLYSALRHGVKLTLDESEDTE